MGKELLEVLRSASSAPQVADLVRRIFDVELPRTAGVLHPAAVWRGPGGGFVTLKIEAGSPRSEVDFFVLNLARARSDAILTTGKILREEPEVSHGLQGPGQVPQALAAWRRERLGKLGLPTSLVLTSGRQVDLDHPVFAGDTVPLIFTTEGGRQCLERAASRRGIEVVSHPSPGVRAAVELLEQRGAETVSIEAGPSTSIDLYRAPIRVDELLLAVYEGPLLAPPLRGEAFLSTAEIEGIFPSRSRDLEVQETSGPWRFTRFQRQP